MSRDCICADPENCTEPVPGYICRKKDRAQRMGMMMRETKSFEDVYAVQTARIAELEVENAELKTKLAKKVSLPKITDELLDEWRGPIYLILATDNDGQMDWTQSAVEFAVLLAGEALNQQDKP